MSGPSHSAGRGGGRTPFVGRDAELAILHERLSAAGRGEGSVVLLAGEPGIGKTRLDAEQEERAGADGWTVLTGRAYQADGLPPYLPWVEALRGYVRAAEPAELHARLGDGAAELARLLPELAALLPGLTPAAALSPEHERYRLFESVTEALLALARGSEFRVPRSESSSSTLRTRNSELGTGLLLVLDDIHWADVSSLQLLVHFARRLAGAPVLVAGTYRDIEVDRGHPFADVQAELVRTGVSDEIALRGLDEVDVGRFIELTAAVTPSPEVVRGVHRETEGNPLFVVELVRLLLAEGGCRNRRDKSGA